MYIRSMEVGTVSKRINAETTPNAAPPVAGQKRPYEPPSIEDHNDPLLVLGLSGAKPLMPPPKK